VGLTEGAGVSESLVADVAHERLLVAVNEHMLSEGLLRREAFVTRRTDMGLV